MFFFNGPNGSSCSQRFISNIQIRGITECPFIRNVFWWSQRKTPTALFTFLPGLSFPLFQNKLDFSPGSSVQGNPLEKGPGSGEISLLLVEGNKKKRKNTWRRMGERQRPLQRCSPGSFPFCQSRSSWLAPFTAGGVRPTGGTAWWGISPVLAGFYAGPWPPFRPRNLLQTRAWPTHPSNFF